MSIYLDNAATTRVRPEVFEAMTPYFTEMYGNPSSVYRIARAAKNAIEESREKVAALIGADAREIYFTGSGTEADNWAVVGAAKANAEKGRHIITTSVEHHALLHTCEFLEKEGFEVTYLPVDKYGLVDISDLERAIRPDTILITVMFANNEIGTIQPVADIGRIARGRGIIFHSDAVQAAGHVPIDVKEMNIDMLSLSAHKIYAQKGVGALYVRKGVRINTLLHGGAQERNRRAGTENVPGIVGLGRACELAADEMSDEGGRIAHLRDTLISRILTEIPHTSLNGHPEKRLPGNVNISYAFVEGESILLSLDLKDIYASSGSACTSGSLDPSHVLLATGLSHEQAHGSVRMSLGKYNTEEEIEVVVKELIPIIERLRAMSPLYEDFQKQAGRSKSEHRDLELLAHATREMKKNV